MGCDGSRPADCSIYKSIYKPSILDLSTPLKEDRATSLTTLHAAAQPLHLSELICHYLQSRSLRSSNTNLLARPSWITTATFPLGPFLSMHHLPGSVLTSAANQRPYKVTVLASSSSSRARHFLIIGPDFHSLVSATGILCHHHHHPFVYTARILRGAGSI